VAGGTGTLSDRFGELGGLGLGGQQLLKPGVACYFKCSPKLSSFSSAGLHGTALHAP